MISVVVPCHNYGRFLGDALASIEHQTRLADEIVIVDDGSTDDTLRVAKEYASRQSNVLVLTRSPARGLPQTLNDGFSETTGDLLVGLSADDRLSPNYLGEMEAAFADEEVGFAYCNERYFGALTGEREAPDFDSSELAIENPYNGSAMFRRSVFTQTGGFRQDLAEIGLEDWEFWVHAVALGWRGAKVPSCWLEYRRHPTGSRNSLPRRKVLVAHLRVHRLHPTVVTRRHLMRWFARSLKRTVRRTTIRV